MSDLALARDLGVAAPPRHAISRKRLALTAAGLALAAGIGWYGYHWWTVGRFFETTDDAYVGGDVTVIAPKIAGFIATVAVTDNQAVHAGDLLVHIDDRDYRAALAMADAAVAAQNATLANIDANRRLQLAMIAQAAAEIASTDAETVRTRIDQARYRALSLTAAGSVQSFEKADADYKKAAAAGQMAAAVLDASQRQLDVIPTQKQQTEAALAGAIADRDTARLNLGYTDIRAPVDGTIGNRSARAGAFASIGAQVMSVVPATGLWVDADIIGLPRGQDPGKGRS